MIGNSFKLIQGKEEKLVQDVCIEKKNYGRCYLTFLFQDNSLQKITIDEVDKFELFCKHLNKGEIKSCHMFSFDVCWTVQSGKLFGMNYSQN